MTLFTCVCGGKSFYTDYLSLLSENVITDASGYPCLQPTRIMYYYTCVACDKRYVYNVSSGAFILAGGSAGGVI